MEHRLRHNPGRLTRPVHTACRVASLLLIVSITMTPAFIYGENPQTAPSTNSSAPQADFGGIKDRLDFADGLYNRNLYDLAAVEYLKFIRDYPQHERAADCRFRLAESYYQLKQPENALKYFQEFLSTPAEHPQKATAQLRTGEILYQLDRKQEALEHFKTISSTLPAGKNLTAAYLAGRIHYDMGQWEQALAEFDKVSLAKEEHAQKELASLYRGETLIKLNRPDAAIEQFKQLMASNDKETRQRAAASLAMAQYQNKAYAEAAANFKLASETENSELAETYRSNRLLALYSGGMYAELVQTFNDPKKLADGPAKSMEMLMAADAYQRLKQPTNALPLFDSVIAAENSNPKDREAAQIGKAECLLELSRAEEAYQALKQYPQETKFNPDRWIYIDAKSAVQSGHHAEALIQYGKLLQEFPESPYHAAALLEQAYLFLDTNRIPEAIQHLSRFTDRYPDHPLTERTLANRIKLEIQSHLWTEAIGHAEEFIARYPAGNQTEDIQYDLTTLYLETRQYPKAIGKIESHLAQYPNSTHKPQLLFSRAYTRQLSGQMEEAVKEYKSLPLETLPEDLRYAAIKNTAYCYIQLNQLDKAADQYVQLIRQPGNTDLDDEIYLWLLEYFIKANKPGESELIFKELDALPVNRANPLFLFYRAENERLNGRFEAATLQYGEYLAKDQLFLAPASVGLGLAQLEKKQFDDAITSFNSAIHHAGDDFETSLKAREGLSATYEAMGNHEESAKASLAIAILYEDAAVVPAALSRAANHFLAAGKTDEAKRCVTELVERYPNHPLAINAANKSKTATP